MHDTGSFTSGCISINYDSIYPIHSARYASFSKLQNGEGQKEGYVLTSRTHAFTRLRQVVSYKLCNEEELEEGCVYTCASAEAD